MKIVQVVRRTSGSPYQWAVYERIGDSCRRIGDYCHHYGFRPKEGSGLEPVPSPPLDIEEAWAAVRAALVKALTAPGACR